ncbi:MAG TPA: GNAT family N-acetyltransferase [Kineosporiaceae bacterium]|nr:GNAT family N-acetyltransferase [Kineosporiaceae bacterium]
MTADDLLLREGTPADWPAVSRLFGEAFQTLADPELIELDGHLFEPSRSVLAIHGDAVVGHTGSYGRTLRLPGTDVRAAHVALVAVAPDHRRRGLLSRLMARQLSDLRTAGEPVAVLWASEGRIYPRYGFGLATTRWVLQVDTREIAQPPIEPTAVAIRVVEPSQAASSIRTVYEHVRLDRPGWSSRGDSWWQYRILADPPARRRGATPWRAVLHDSADGTEDGYALWRVLPHWDTAGPCGQVEVREIVTDSPQAYAAIWRFLLGLDLTRSVKYPVASPDEPLVYLSDEPRRLAAQLADGLWLRIIDLQAALSVRRYATPIDVVVEVSDALLAEKRGRWHVCGDSAGARCEPTTTAPDLSCDVADLSAALLGDGALVPLAGSGRVRELRRGSLTAAHLAFSWPRRPSAIEMF